MIHDVFGNITFHVGWKTGKEIELFGRHYEINLKIQAYFQEDGITLEQENAYKEFCKDEADKMHMIENLLRSYAVSPEEQFVPRTLLIQRDGACALLCDDQYAPDGGMQYLYIPKWKLFFRMIICKICL